MPKLQVDFDAVEDSTIYSVKALNGLKDKAAAVRFIVKSFGEQRK